MLIAQEQSKQFFRGILGQTATATIIATPVPTPTPTVIVTPTVSPTPTATVAVEPFYTVITSPTDYAKHALEYAFKANGLPLTRRASQTALTQAKYNAVLDYAVQWAARVPKKYIGLTNGQRYEIKAGTAERYTTRAYLERYLTAYYNYSLQETALPVTTYAPLPTATATVGVPPITADVGAIVRRVLQFSQIPIMPGTIRGDIYDNIVKKAVGDLQYIEYTQTGKKAPPGVTYDQIRAQYRTAVISYLNSLGITRGSTSQATDFIPTATTAAGPVSYSQERAWWASTDRERAEWAVKAAMQSLRISYRKGSTIVTPEQASQILSGAMAFLQAVMADPVIVRDSGDRRDIQIAMGLINNNLLGNMGIKVSEKPDWQEQARKAIAFYLSRTTERSITEEAYAVYLAQVTALAISYWKNVAAPYRLAGGALIEPSSSQVKAYVDQQLRQQITITQTVTVSPTVTYIPRPTVTTTVTPTPTPVTATPTLSQLNSLASNALNKAIRQLNILSHSQVLRYGTAIYYRVPAPLFDEMIETAISEAVSDYGQTQFASVHEMSRQDWEKLIRARAQAARLIRTVAVVTPTPTATLPITQYITTTTPTPMPTIEEQMRILIAKVFGAVLPKHGLAQRYPQAYYIPDVRRREVLSDLVYEAAKYHSDPIYAIATLSSERIEQELRERNILPESEYAAGTVATPIVSADAALREWAANAPIFDTYAQCRAAAEQEVGRPPDRWRDCLTEEDIVDQAVTFALTQRGIRAYPGALEMPLEAFNDLAEVGYAIAQQMVYQRTYTPVFGGKVLQLAQ